jgi:hypothetical protein
MQGVSGKLIGLQGRDSVVVLHVPEVVAALHEQQVTRLKQVIIHRDEQGE